MVVLLLHTSCLLLHDLTTLVFHDQVGVQHMAHTRTSLDSDSDPEFLPARARSRFVSHYLTTKKKQKAMVAQAAGAVGLVVINNEPRHIFAMHGVSEEEGATSSVDIPVVMVRGPNNTAVIQTVLSHLF